MSSLACGPVRTVGHGGACGPVRGAKKGKAVTRRRTPKKKAVNHFWLTAFCLKRRARDSNSQPLTGHLISNPSPNAENTEENGPSEASAAVGAAVYLEDGQLSPELRTIVEVWPQLGIEVKAAILALVHVGGKTK